MDALKYRTGETNGAKIDEKSREFLEHNGEEYFEITVWMRKPLPTITFTQHNGSVVPCYREDGIVMSGVTRALLQKIMLRPEVRKISINQQ